MVARLLVVSIVLLVACEEDGSSGPGTTCAYKDPGTIFAPCKSDSDCFGQFCDETGKPGPYCPVPGQNQVDALRGLTCTSDSDGTKVLPADKVSAGIAGRCTSRTNRDPNVCAFDCATDTTSHLDLGRLARAGTGRTRTRNDHG